MNFNIYLDKDTGERLSRLAKVKRVSRNTLIRSALARLVERDAEGELPAAILDLQGVPEMRSFEESRQDLGAVNKDPMAI